MTNHPRRSAQTRTFYMWQPHVGTLNIFVGTAAQMPRQAGDRWQAIASWNNRPAPYSAFDDNLEAIGRAMADDEMALALRDLPSNTRDGDEFTFWDGRWRLLNGDGTFAD